MNDHRLSQPEIRDVPPTEAQRMVETGALLIDVRELDEYQQVRIPGSEFRPLSNINGWYQGLPTDTPVVLYCNSGSRSAQATAALTHQAGFTNIVNMEGGIVEWYEQGLPVTTEPVETSGYGLPFTEMEPDRAAKEIENGELRWIVDVRPEVQFLTGHVPGANNIPLEQLPMRYSELPRAEPVLVTCDRGEVSELAARLLVDLGFGDIRTLQGGIESWRYHNLTLTESIAP